MKTLNTSQNRKAENIFKHDEKNQQQHRTNLSNIHIFSSKLLSKLKIRETNKVRTNGQTQMKRTHAKT